MPTVICGVDDDEIDQAVALLLNTGRAWRARSETRTARRARILQVLTAAADAVGSAEPGSAAMQQAWWRRDEAIRQAAREGLADNEQIAAAAQVSEFAVTRARDDGYTDPMPFLVLDDAGFARRLGVELTTFRAYVSRGRTPEPDVTLGSGRGWHLDTVEKWIAGRPRQVARAGA
jgi:hypothetical protein